MTDIQIFQATEAPDRKKMNALLMGYYTGMISNLKSVGGPDVDPAEPIADFWDHLDQFLPPNGCLLIAHDADTWLGTGALRNLPGGKGELKRLFLRPETRGTGLGRRLVTERIRIAHQMGLKTLVVDTLSTTVEMQALYASLGLRKTDPYPKSVSYNMFPHLVEYMLFFRKDL